MTQDQLGEKIGLSAMAISHYERESRFMKPTDICAFCDLFNVTADYLLCRSNAPRPTVSNSDTALLHAYHAAPLEIRRIVDAALASYMETGKTEEAPAS